MPHSINLCRCGEIFNTYYCKRCDCYQQNSCKSCHESHFSEINRMKGLARLKRGISN